MRSLICLLGTAFLLYAPFRAHGQEEKPTSAWDTILRKDPILIENIANLEREILERITYHQLKAYLLGGGTSEITLINGESLKEFLIDKAASSFDLSWYSVDGGGDTLTGEDITLTGSLGQPDSGTMNGGEFTVTGGFLGITLSFCDSPVRIFCDGFESGDLTEWSSFVGTN